MRASFFASRSLTRAGFVASFMLLAACGSDGPTPFALTVIGDDGTVASGAPIVRSAIDRVQVVLAPQAIDGPFAPMPERVFDGGAASTRVSAARTTAFTMVPSGAGGPAVQMCSSPTSSARRTYSARCSMPSFSAMRCL